MCGIAGYVLNSEYNLENWRNHLKNFSQKLTHRGPDNGSYYVWDGYNKHDFLKDSRCLEQEINYKPICGVMHRRLSVIDINNISNQPMISDCGRYILSFNGEIYNYIELRQELKRAGCEFKTASDTEVLLHGLINWGPQYCHKFIGMFSYCFIDRKRSELILGRDPYGIKPLFYSSCNKNLIFASEIKALLDWPDITRKANSDIVRSYITMGIVNYDDSSFYQDIKSVPPGYYLKCNTASPSDLNLFCYLPKKIERLSNNDLCYEEAQKKLKDLFIKSVELHTRSDIGFGTLLSGGLDSSAIAGAIRITNSNKDLRSYSFVSPGDDCDEANWAEMVNSHYQLNASYITATADNFFEDMGGLVDIQEEPFGSTSIYAQYKIFEAISRDNQTVVLDGQGADEIFAGYLPYYSAHVASLISSGEFLKALSIMSSLHKNKQTTWWNVILRSVSRLVPEKIGNFIHYYYTHANQNKIIDWSWFNDRDVIANNILVSGLQKNLDHALFHDMTSCNLPGLLRYEDRNSMHFSVESRVPFLNFELVQFAQSLPADWLIDQDGRNKAILRDAVSDFVPNSVVKRRDKIGFATPEDRWFKHNKCKVNQLLNNIADADLPFFNHSQASKYWDEHQNSAKPFNREIWRWINLSLWSQKNNIDYT